MAYIETTQAAGRPTRLTSHINRKPASNVHHAARIADHIGLSLNRLVTLNFELTECVGDDASRRFARLRTNYFGKWATRPPRGSHAPGTPPTFVWSLERGGGHLAAHWLVHVPPGRFREFEARLPSWLIAVAGELLSPRAIHVRPAPTPRSASKYLLKGIDPAYAAFYGINHVPQGIVAGRRSGMSRNLGPTVKRRLRENGEYRVARWSRPFPNGRPIH
jgi:hypothetical protein